MVYGNISAADGPDKFASAAIAMDQERVTKYLASRYPARDIEVTDPYDVQLFRELEKQKRKALWEIEENKGRRAADRAFKSAQAAQRKQPEAPQPYRNANIVQRFGMEMDRLLDQAF